MAPILESSFYWFQSPIRRLPKPKLVFWLWIAISIVTHFLTIKAPDPTKIMWHLIQTRTTSVFIIIFFLLIGLKLDGVDPYS